MQEYEKKSLQAHHKVDNSGAVSYRHATMKHIQTCINRNKYDKATK